MTYAGPNRRAGNANAALARQDRLARHLRLIALAGMVFVGLVITVALIVGFGSISRAERYAKEANDQARTNASIARNVETLVAQQAPCLENDPPDSPACVRKARSDAIVAAAIADIVAGIDTHDLNAEAAHDQLLKHHAGSAPKRTPITSAPRRSAKPAPTTATASPAPSTTTTCPKRGKSEKCR